MALEGVGSIFTTLEEKSREEGKGGGRRGWTAFNANALRRVYSTHVKSNLSGHYKLKKGETAKGRLGNRGCFVLGEVKGGGSSASHMSPWQWSRYLI